MTTKFNSTIRKLTIIVIAIFVLSGIAVYKRFFTNDTNIGSLTSYSHIPHHNPLLRKHKAKERKIIPKKPEIAISPEQRSGLSANGKRTQQIADHSLLLAEFRIIDTEKIPESYSELRGLVLERMASADAFVSPYYEEICDHLLSKISAWLVNDSEWPVEKILAFVGDICGKLQENERDSIPNMDSFIKKLAFAAYSSEDLKRQILEAKSGQDQGWLANLQGTMIALDINRYQVPEDRLQAINNIQDQNIKTYAERLVLMSLSGEEIEQARSFFLSNESSCVNDSLVLGHLFPNPDEDTLDTILNSRNIIHRDWAIGSLVLKKFYLNDLAGANFLVTQIQDEDLKAKAIRSINAAQSRRKQLKGISPPNAPPGIFE